MRGVERHSGASRGSFLLKMWGNVIKNKSIEEHIEKNIKILIDLELLSLKKSTE